MIAARYYGKGDIRIDELEKPVPKDNEALVKIIYGGICGSDLHIYRQGMFMTYAPETLGHEFVGKVEIAPSESSFNPGDIVTASPSVTCGQCEFCLKGDYIHCPSIGYMGEVRPGGFANYLVLEASKLIKFAPGVDLVEAGLVEPIAVAHHSGKRMACGPQDRVAVFGCGPIGTMIAYLLKHIYRVGWITMIDIDPYRRSQALKCGADEVVASYQEGKYQSYSHVLDAAGSENAVNLAIEAVEPGGKVFVIAIYEQLPVIDTNLAITKEITVSFNSSHTLAEIKEAVEIVNKGEHKFAWVVSNIVKGKDVPEAFRTLAQREKKDVKVLLDFSD